MLGEQELVNLVLSSFSAEQRNDVEGNLRFLTDDYKYTDLVLENDGSYFPSKQGHEMRKLMKQAFKIGNREFEFKSTAANVDTQTVFIEFVESYPDPGTGKVYRTPQVAICKIKNGKIQRTRHYMDPRLSKEYLSEEDIGKAFE